VLQAPHGVAAEPRAPGYLLHAPSAPVAKLSPGRAVGEQGGGHASGRGHLRSSIGRSRSATHVARYAPEHVDREVDRGPRPRSFRALGLLADRQPRTCIPRLVRLLRALRSLLARTGTEVVSALVGYALAATVIVAIASIIVSLVRVILSAAEVLVSGAVALLELGGRLRRDERLP
jgi:hypothetical protein